MEWNMEYGIWNMEYGIWNIGYQTSVMSQELHFYHKVVNVLDLYHSHLNLYIYKVCICLGT